MLIESPQRISKKNRQKMCTVRHESRLARFPSKLSAKLAEKFEESQAKRTLAIRLSASPKRISEKTTKEPHCRHAIKHRPDVFQSFFGFLRQLGPKRPPKKPRRTQKRRTRHTKSSRLKRIEMLHKPQDNTQNNAVRAPALLALSCMFL